MAEEEKTPVVLAGVGNGCGFVAEAACESDWDMATEAGLLSECAAAELKAGAPLGCEPIEAYGGDVGVRGWMGVFVWPLALATTSKGGDAGEKRPVWSSRWRLAVCSDMKTARGGDAACRRERGGAAGGVQRG
jgi:hypothetical protein